MRKRIGKYVVLGRIGKGGMGMVYRGRDELLERDVAVKTLTVEGTLDEESRQRFQIEAKAAAKLQHPNIVTVFELGEERGLPYIAMELLPGADLESLLRSGEPLLLQEKLDILVQVCRGLQYAHEHRVVHRDVKPSNIRLLEDGTAKIMDFGIAKLGSTGVTKTGMMVGTVHYMSPEQVRGHALDGRSDVFSVGVILHEMLAGSRPFPAETASAVLYKIVNAPNPRLETAPGLQEVLDRALAKEPDRRYPSAAALADDLEKARTRVGGASITLAPDKLETVNLSRRLLKEGRVDECLRRIEPLAEESPHSLEARRLLRAARREMQRRRDRPAPAEEEFPELEATYRAATTRRAPETALLPTELRPPPAAEGPAPVVAAPVAGKGLLRAGAFVGVMVVAAGTLLVLRGGGGETKTSGTQMGRDQPPPAVPRPGPAVDTGAAPARAALPVITEPPGAVVTLDGRPVAGVTPLRLELDAAVEHRLSVAREGHAPQELHLRPGQLPREVRLALEPAGLLGRVRVASAYPVDVLWKGRVLSKGQPSSQLDLPAGRQTLTLVSSAYFLRLSVNVDVRANGAAGVEAPGLGKIHIRAQPDNCRVFIDGAFVDYPPILDRAIAVGSHRVSYAWPDGSRAEDAVLVALGAPAYSMGRKED